MASSLPILTFLVRSPWQQITFTASLWYMGATPTGTVTFVLMDNTTDDQTVLGLGTLDSSGATSITAAINNSPNDSYTLEFFYSGDNNYAAGESQFGVSIL